MKFEEFEKSLCNHHEFGNTTIIQEQSDVYKNENKTTVFSQTYIRGEQSLVCCNCFGITPVDINIHLSADMKCYSDIEFDFNTHIKFMGTCPHCKSGQINYKVIPRDFAKIWSILSSKGYHNHIYFKKSDHSLRCEVYIYEDKILEDFISKLDDTQWRYEIDADIPNKIHCILNIKRYAMGLYQMIGLAQGLPLSDNYHRNLIDEFLRSYDNDGQSFEDYLSEHMKKLNNPKCL